MNAIINDNDKSSTFNNNTDSLKDIMLGKFRQEYDSLLNSLNENKNQINHQSYSPELMSIPYETEIEWIRDNTKYTYWIPFMYITGVRFGPILIRRQWWFQYLLPHLQTLDHTLQINDNEWFDMEISLHTWSLGGHVGLYHAKGFLIDRESFSNEIQRNEELNSEFHNFVSEHMLSNDNLKWNVWNVTHLLKLNENETTRDMRLRTGTPDGSINWVHSSKLKASRQPMLIWRGVESLLNISKY